jgi:phosphoglycolate phosphatase
VSLRSAGRRGLLAFDLDHTLVRSPLDLVRLRAEVRELGTRHGLALPEATSGWTIAQFIEAIAERSVALAHEAWRLVLEHETHALEGVVAEPGAGETLAALRARGFVLAVWTNNARPAAALALRRTGLGGFFARLVTRDEARLKPDPDGLRLLREVRPEGPAWVVGDSWIDGAAARAGGVGFIAYRADPGELRRHGVTPQAFIDDLRLLPAWLAGLRPPVG